MTFPCFPCSNAADEFEFKDYYVRTTKSLSLSNVELFAEPKFRWFSLSASLIRDGKV